MQNVTIKNVSEEGKILFKDVFIGQYFEYFSSLYIKLHDDYERNNSWNMSAEAEGFVSGNTNVRLVSEINIEYKLYGGNT